MTSATATMWKHGGASRLLPWESVDRVLIFDGLQPDTRLMPINPASHLHSIGRSLA